MSKELYDFLADLAWPLVALIGLIFIWRTDALGKLSKLSAAADTIKGSIADMVVAQEKLSETAMRVGEATQSIEGLNNRLIEIGSGVASIRDQVDSKHGAPVPDAAPTAQEIGLLPKYFSDMEKAWEKVNQALEERFGPFDRRSTANVAYAFAHGNRRNRITYELAEQIGSLHSSIKSYRRRQNVLTEWLTEAVRDEFVLQCGDVCTALKTSV